VGGISGLLNAFAFAFQNVILFRWANESVAGQIWLSINFAFDWQIPENLFSANALERKKPAEPLPIIVRSRQPGYDGV
jgi:hypothetical protein